MIDELEVMLKSAVTDVFKTMLQMDVQPGPLAADGNSNEPQVAGSVGFIGDITGVVYIYCTVGFAKLVTGTVVGLPPEEVEGDELVNDSMGELANMIVGSLKAKLVEKGHACVLTIPSIVRGSHFSIEATSTTTRRVGCFRCQDGASLVVEILIKPAEGND